MESATGHANRQSAPLAEEWKHPNGYMCVVLYIPYVRTDLPRLRTLDTVPTTEQERSVPINQLCCIARHYPTGRASAVYVAQRSVAKYMGWNDQGDSLRVKLNGLIYGTFSETRSIVSARYTSINPPVHHACRECSADPRNGFRKKRPSLP